MYLFEQSLLQISEKTLHLDGDGYYKLANMICNLHPAMRIAPSYCLFIALIWEEIC